MIFETRRFSIVYIGKSPLKMVIFDHFFFKGTYWNSYWDFSTKSGPKKSQKMAKNRMRGWHQASQRPFKNWSSAALFFENPHSAERD